MILLAPTLMPRRVRRKNPIVVGRRQLPFLRSPATFRALVGGRGSGKTFGGALAGWEEAGRQQCTGIIVAPTYTMLNDDVVPVLRKVAGETLVHFSESDMEGTFWNGSQVLLRSAPDSVHINRLRGPSVSWVWMDEAAHVPEGEEAWKILMATLREGGRMGRAWLTTTPRGKGWIHRLFKVAGDPDYELFGAHTNDNEFTSAKYKKILQAAYGIGWFAKQELAGEFCDPEGSCFQREWFQIVEPGQVPEFDVKHRGWDLAWTLKTTSDYTVGVLVGITETGDIYILDVIRDKWKWPDARREIIRTALEDGETTHVHIESVAFQAVAVQEMLEEPELGNHVIADVHVDRDKLSYALPIAARAKEGKLYVLQGEWNKAYLDELCDFCGDGKGHDDQVSGTTIAYRGAMEPHFGFRTD